MKARLLKKLRKQANERITLQPLYGSKSIGIYNYDKWYTRDVLYSYASPSEFKSIEDALPKLQELREDYVRDAAKHIRLRILRKELEKY